MSQTKTFIASEITRVNNLITKNRTEISYKEKMILGQTQEIDRWQEELNELHADLEKLS